MYRKTLIVYISLVCLFTLIAISCNITVDDCGPFDDKFKIIQFTVQYSQAGTNLNYFEFTTNPVVITN